LHVAQTEYDQATTDQKGEAKLEYLAALRRFSDFVMRGWP
jgi:hypothetical protein